MSSVGQIVVLAGLALGGILAFVYTQLQQERPYTHDRSPPGPNTHDRSLPGPHTRDRSPPRRDNATGSTSAPNYRLPQCQICKDELDNNTPLIKVECCGNTFHKECYDAYRTVLRPIKGYYPCPSCSSKKTS